MASARDTKFLHHGLLELAGIGIPQIIAGARPAEFRDHDPLARELVAQQLVHGHGLIDRLLVGEVFPVRQNVGGDEIHGVGELRIVAPDIPDFAGRDGNVDRFLDPLDQLDQVVDLLIGAIHRLVADHDADHVAVVPGQIDRGIDFALVALGVLVDPGADHHLEAEFGSDRRHQFVAFRRRVQADRSRQGGEFLQIGADLLGVGDAVGDGVTRFKRRIGSARQHTIEVGGLLPVP